MNLHRRLLLAAACLATPFAASAQDAANWPTRPVTWIVPFAPGGSTDVVARVIGQEMSKALQQPVVIDNRPGAGGSIAVAQGARAAADGYTVTGGTISTHAINVALFKNLAYDPVADFEPVILLAYVPNLLMVSPKLGVNNVEELVAYLKQNPQQAGYASSGIGTSTHLTGARMAELLDLPMTHVPYKGSPQALQDVAAGNVPFLFDQLTAGLPMVQADKLKFLAITSDTRSPLVPDVPTMAEAGVPGLDMVSWQALYVPKGTPPEVVAKLNAAARQALEAPAVKEQLENKLGMTIVGGSPEELTALMQQDIQRLGELVRNSGVEAQ